MKHTITILLATLLSSVGLQAAQLDVFGVLNTDASIRTFPVSLYWDTTHPDIQTVTPHSVILQMPLEFPPIPDQGESDWQIWPQISFQDGVPHTLLFMVDNPFNGISRLEANGVLCLDRNIGDITILGWSVDAYLVPGRTGSRWNQEESGIMPAQTQVPEPRQYALLGGLGLLGLAAARRRIRSPTVAVSVGCLLASTTMFTGCSSMTVEDRMATAESLANLAAYNGTAVHLLDNEQDTAYFVLAVEALDRLAQDGTFRPADLAAALEDIPLPKLQDKGKASVVITGTVMVYDEVARRFLDPSTPEEVRRVAAAIRDGIALALYRAGP